MRRLFPAVIAALVAAFFCAPAGAQVAPGTPILSQFNLTQVAGASVATGHGTAAGSLRVELPTDGTGLVNAAQSGNWTSRIVGNAGATLDIAGGILQIAPVPTSLSTAGITPVPSAAAEASHVLKASAGNFYSASASNLSGTGGFCLVINATSAPTTGSAVTPLFFQPLPANGSCAISTLGGPPGVFSTGITFLVSSNASPFTFTSGVITAAISGMVQ